PDGRDWHFPGTIRGVRRSDVLRACVGTRWTIACRRFGAPPNRSPSSSPAQDTGFSSLVRGFESRSGRNFLGHVTHLPLHQVRTRARQELGKILPTSVAPLISRRRRSAYVVVRRSMAEY